MWTYGYDLDNHLTSADKTGLAATLAYDGEGRLNQTVIAGVTSNLSYDDSAGTLLRRFVHGPGIDQPLVWFEGATTANAINNATAIKNLGPGQLSNPAIPPGIWQIHDRNIPKSRWQFSNTFLYEPNY